MGNRSSQNLNAFAHIEYVEHVIPGNSLAGPQDEIIDVEVAVDSLVAHYEFDDVSDLGKDSKGGASATVTGVTAVNGISSTSSVVLHINNDTIEDIAPAGATIVDPGSVVSVDSKLVFDGLNGMLLSGINLDMSRNFYLQFKVKCSNANVAYILTAHSATSAYLHLQSNIDGSTRVLASTNGTSWDASLTSDIKATLNDDLEHHVVFSRFSNRLYLYIDGTLVYDKAYSASLIVPQVFLGTIYTRSGYFLPAGGYMKDIQLSYTGVNPKSRTVLLLNSSGTNGSSDMTGLDTSLFKNTFTNTSVVHSTAKSLPGSTSSLYFNGSSRLLWNTNVSPLGDSEFELSVWVYPTVAATGYIFADWASADYDFCLYLSSSAGFKVSLNNDAPVLSFGSNTTSVLNKWSHLKVSRVGDTVHTFLNGVRVESATYTGSLDLTAVGIGSNSTGVTQALTGYIQYLKLDIGKGYSNDFELHTGAPDAVRDFTPPVTLPVPSAGEYGLAGRMTSSSSVRCSSDIFNGPNYGSIAFWVKPESLVGSPMLVARRDATHPAIQMQILDTGSVRILVWNGTTWGINLSTPVSLITINQWWHIGVTIDTSINECKIYINGEIKATQVYSGTLTTQPIDMTLGFFDLDSSSKLTGSIDDFRFYNKALTQEEMQQLYRPGLVVSALPPVASYDFTDGVEDIITLPVIAINTTIQNDVSDYLAVGPSIDGRIDLTTPATDPTQTLGRDGVTSNALGFDGTEDIDLATAGIPDPFAQTNASISMWIKLDVSSYGGILSNWSAPTGNRGWLLQAVDGHASGNDFHLQISPNGTSANIMAIEANITPTVFRHLLITKSGTSWEAFLNGVSVGTMTSAIFTPTSSSLKIGSYLDGASSTQFGTFEIEDIKFYNVALTAEDVSYLYTESVAKRVGIFLEDKSGNSHGVINGTIPVESSVANLPSAYVGQAYQFNGNAANYVDLSSNPDWNFSGGKSQTLSFWIKTSGIPTATKYIVANSSTSAGNRSWSIAVSYNGDPTPGSVQLLTSNDGTAYSVIRSTKVITDGLWHYVTFVISPTYRAIFIDGQLNVSETGSFVVFNINKTAVGNINKDNTDSQWCFAGSIADLKLDSRVLSSQEIKLRYIQSLPAISDLGTPLVHYDMSISGGDLVDVSGNGHDVVGITGPTQVDGRKNFAGEITGKALSFNGVDQSVTGQSAGLPYGNSNRSIAFWIKRNDTAISKAIIGYGAWATTAQGFTVGIDNANKLTLSCYDRNYTVTAAGTLNDLNWHHVVVTWNGSDASIYQDAVKQASTLTSGTAGAINTVEALPLRIGSHFGVAGLYINALIDEVIVFGKSLSPQEISGIYYGKTTDALPSDFTKPVTLPSSDGEIIIGGIAHAVKSNDTATTLRQRLETNYNIGSGNVEVTGTFPNFSIKFVGKFAGRAFPLPVVSGNPALRAASSLTQSQAGAEGGFHDLILPEDRPGIITVVKNVGGQSFDISNEAGIGLGRENGIIRIQKTSPGALTYDSLKVIEWRNT